jgi:Na+-transporting methylmalonyl-CoA/oxaloacetate decarboxylase gamma subunit
MFWVIAAVVGTVATTVGTTAYSAVAQKNASDEMVKNQKEAEVKQAIAASVSAWTSVPGSIPI